MFEALEMDRAIHVKKNISRNALPPKNIPVKEGMPFCP
jgi:hypothetical protein